ncbi:Cro/CI family transcriptional regulator [Marinomonas sp. BSi20584]|uniref:Cro/CI family transcriptional regulator n=1 Tax=Marinomonas sp. BSi20584 TaxID=1594462 RepID=UPI000C1EAB11|nr:Cro/CI family transcriptional regulator [Marinomonas sp. BSi20584]PJE55630.1 hypothetical protein TY87_09190 [Marinomonas sp. BSi20584]
MDKTSVIEFYGNNQSEVARVLNITRASVSCWPDRVPELQAMKLERLTDGALKYDASLYMPKHKQTA